MAFQVNLFDGWGRNSDGTIRLVLMLGAEQIPQLHARGCECLHGYCGVRFGMTRQGGKRVNQNLLSN